MNEFRKYFREKRIRRILNFYHELQPHTDSPKRYKRIPFISRDTRVHFILTLIFLAVLGKLISPLHIPFIFHVIIVGFLAVELADYIMIRGVKFFDTLFDYILPIGGLILILGLIWAQKEFRLIDTWKENVLNFRERYNNKLQSQPKKNVASVGTGDNWFIGRFEKGDSHPLTLPEATKECADKGMRLYDGDFTFDPPLLLNSRQYFWVKDMPGILGPGEVTAQNAWTMPEKNSRALALCVRKSP